jgi:hypothetical protein
MATAEAPRALPGELGAEGRWHGRAFGLEISGPAALRGIAPAAPTDALRRVMLERVDAAALDAFCGSAPAERLVDFRFADGDPMMRIDARGGAGFEIQAPRHGSHLVSPDGALVRSVLPEDGSRRWERLLAAQVLPLAAALQGLEPLHASAVSLGDRAVAFVAPSGVGKTSIAARLVADGATFVADDVLAVEPLGEALLAHPGVGLLNMPDADGEKMQVAVVTAGAPLPLAAVYFLRAGAEDERLRVESEHPPAARRLLAGTFLRYLRSPERLVVHLDVCARIGATVPAFEVVLPKGVSPVLAAAAVRDHLERA